MASPDEVARFWDKMAARYDRASESMQRGGQVARSRGAAVKRLLGDGPGDLLDAGMGPGRLLAELSARGWTVNGVDLSKEMVELARQRLPAAADRITEGQIEALPFAEASFDAVVVTGVLEYVGYRAGALREVARVLRPGGIAVVSTPNRRAPYHLWSRVVARVVPPVKRVIPVGRPNRPPGPRPPLREEFERMLAGAGLDVQAIEYAGGVKRRQRGTQIVFAAWKPG
jgi:ubiquinone/menaquinone biosynthesis C-methylase UbiE